MKGKGYIPLLLYKLTRRLLLCHIRFIYTHFVEKYLRQRILCTWNAHTAWRKNKAESEHEVFQPTTVPLPGKLGRRIFSRSHLVPTAGGLLVYGTH